jgi:hypothetical protein
MRARSRLGSDRVLDSFSEVSLRMLCRQGIWRLPLGPITVHIGLCNER